MTLNRTMLAYSESTMRIFATFFLLAVASPLLAEAATLVEKGKARAVIIVPVRPSPVVANAARVLRDHIKLMSGAELPIHTERQDHGFSEPGTRLGFSLERAS